MSEEATPGALGSNAGLGVIPRATWEERYAAQVRKRAGQVLSGELAKAQASGKTKVTAKTILGGSVSLEKAIQREIDSGGAERAETLCPAHAGLIAYLRGSTTVKVRELMAA